MLMALSPRKRAFSFVLTSEERPANSPENEEDSNGDQVWPNFSKNVEHLVDTHRKRIR